MVDELIKKIEDTAVCPTCKKKVKLAKNQSKLKFTGFASIAIRATATMGSDVSPLFKCSKCGRLSRPDLMKGGIVLKDCGFLNIIKMD